MFCSSSRGRILSVTENNRFRFGLCSRWKRKSSASSSAARWPNCRKNSKNWEKCFKRMFVCEQYFTFADLRCLVGSKVEKCLTRGEICLRECCWHCRTFAPRLRGSVHCITVERLTQIRYTDRNNNIGQISGDQERCSLWSRVSSSRRDSTEKRASSPHRDIHGLRGSCAAFASTQSLSYKPS